MRRSALVLAGASGGGGAGSSSGSSSLPIAQRARAAVTRPFQAVKRCVNANNLYICTVLCCV
jgi:hypothetical protein